MLFCLFAMFLMVCRWATSHASVFQLVCLPKLQHAGHVPETGFLGDNHKWLEKVLMEVQLLQQLSHTNLVSYRHVWLENAHLTSMSPTSLRGTYRYLTQSFAAFGPSVPCAFILQQVRLIIALG